jgi:ATP-dependent helicase HrpB
MNRLPVDSIITDILATLATGAPVIVQAPPGSGKSTRIPVALLDAPWLGRQKILMLEPRRLAAANLAGWIASQRHEAVGATVGYAIRFERKISAATRLEIVTEGLLTRRLQHDPFLENVGAVIFDEFHERTIHADTALALCLELQQTVRPDLRIVIMSATLDAAKLAALLPLARTVTSDGGLYPVAIRYSGSFAADPVQRAVQGVSRALREQSGDILVFLPGAGEIRRALAILQEEHHSSSIQFLPLYGDIPFQEQQRALLPADRRKVVLATNIAETSLTIEGVTVVVDAGLVRRARYDRSRALDRLVTERISRAAATQRAGRGGRLQAGVCYRLWSEAEQQALVPFDPPEILTADLGELALNLALWGISDPGQLTWTDPPPAAALEEARRTLRLLGALDEANRITADGRRMADLPLTPRLARLVIAAVESGNGPLGADIAAILAERDFRRSNRQPVTATASDLVDRLETLQEWRSAPASRSSAGSDDRAALRAVDRLSGQLRRLAAISTRDYPLQTETVSLLAAAAFPDRIAARREPGSRRYLLANGMGATLDIASGVIDAAFLVVISLDGGDGGDGRIFAASALQIETIRTAFRDAITRRRRAVWDPALQRVTAREEELLGAIILQSRTVKAEVAEVSSALLDYLATVPSGTILRTTAASAQLQARIQFLRSVFPDDPWPDVNDSALLATAATWLPGVIAAQEKPERFSGVDTETVIQSLLGWKEREQLDQLAPTRLPAPSGSRIQLDYESGDVPVMAVKLQELFGLATTPTVAGGRVAVLIHLLSPAGRPMQVTRDLASFWNSGYPEVRKELKGRYPKHPWPEDPWNAAPTRFAKRRTG